MSFYTFDDYKKAYVDDKIKDNNGDPRHGGGNNKPDATLGELGDNGAKVEPASVVMETFDDKDYATICRSMADVSENIAPGYNDTLHDVAQQIAKGMSDLKDRLMSLENDGGWKGNTHDAAVANLQKSYAIPEELRKAAVSLGVLSEYYSQTMSTNKHNILDQWQTYQQCLALFQNETDTVHGYFDKFARDVMNNYYKPEIEDIAKNQPAVRSSDTPDVGQPTGGDDGGNDAPRSQFRTTEAREPGQSPLDSGDSSGGYEKADMPPAPAGDVTSPLQPDASNKGGGGNDNSSEPPFSPPKSEFSTPIAASPGTEPSVDDNTPAQSFNPPGTPNIKTPELPSGSGDGAKGGSPAGTDPSGTDHGTRQTLPTLGAKTPQLPGLGDPDSPGQPGSSTGGPKFDPSKVLTDPETIDAANKLFNDPKTADAAKKLFGDPKFADAAKTLFGDGAKGLLGNPEALDAAKTLFGDPEAADAAKTLFGDPDTARAAQKLLNDPHLDDIGKALKGSGTLQTDDVPGVDPTDGVGSKSLDRGLDRSGPVSLDDIPGVAAGLAGNSSEGGSSLLGGILDGVNQIVQTALQGGAPQSPEFGGGPDFDAPGGPGDGAGSGYGSGSGGGHGGGAGAGKLHLPVAGAPVAAANFSPLTAAHAVHPGIDPAQGGSSGGAPAGGGHGGGGRGGEGKDHKGNRALRGNHNGQDVIGQPDAVVSVIGEDGDSGGLVWSMDT